MKRPPTLELRGPGGVLPLRAEDEPALDLVMLIDGETSGKPLDDVLRQYGRSRSTYYEKLRRFREAGLAGLLASPPGPRSPWRRPLEVCASSSRPGSEPRPQRERDPRTTSRGSGIWCRSAASSARSPSSG